MNEYVHEHTRNVATGFGVSVTYEPTDFCADPFSLSGHIYFYDGMEIPFRCGSNPEILLVDSDEILTGYLRNRTIQMLWKRTPPEHCLCVTYCWSNEHPLERAAKANWMQEGF